MTSQPIGFSGYSTRNISNNNTNISKSSSPQGMQSSNSSSFIDMNTLLQLLAAQLQNQDPMNPTSQDSYIMQMSQMAMVQSITSMQQTTITTYAASLVGKEVTMAKFEANSDEIKEVVGTVTGVGFFANQPVIYVDGEPFGLSQLMAIGRLPEDEDGDAGDEDGEDKPEGITPELPPVGEKPENSEGVTPEVPPVEEKPEVSEDNNNKQETVSNDNSVKL